MSLVEKAGVEVKGTILHYDGTEWSTMQSGTDGNLIGVWGGIVR